MKKSFTAFLILLCLFAHGQTQRILFLGNSYTYVNNLPQITADIASSLGDTLIFDSNTPGGYTLQSHSTNQTTLNKIVAGTWDFVVLQEQSQLPSLPINQVEEQVFPYARYLDSIINEQNPCGETMFYMTWGRKNGDISNCDWWPPVCTYQGMDNLLRLRYMIMADSNDAVVSPVGAVWRYIRNHFPGIELYSSDESHPSAAGSYAAACCFNTAIFRKDPLQITYDFTLNPTDASNIRIAAKKVVYDSLAYWHIGEYDLVSDFSYVQLNGFTYQFTNQSQNATGQIWDFGISTDTTANPAFTFPGPGTYPVQLTSFNTCDTLTSNDSILVIFISVAETHPFKRLILYPNPASDKLILDLNSLTGISIDIYNLYGINLLSIDHLVNNEIDISCLKPGLYYLKIMLNNRVVTQPFLVNKK